MATKRAWSLLVAFSVVFTVVAGLKMCPNGFVESSPHFVSLNGLKCFNMTGLGSYFWKSQYPLPLEDGVHYASGSGFRVWAPHASSVWVNATLKSSGNHVVPLKQEGYGTWFNNVGGVQAGDTYTFIINYQSKNYTRLDPFAYALDQVTDSVYTQSVVADLSFDWGNTTIPSFSLDQIVIYEMQIPTFNPSSSNGVGTFQQAISKLDYLKELGVTIIEPIPINTYSGDARGWGYNPTVPNTIMNAFGGLNGFRQFVMACHQRGMGVFVDVVWNHMGSPNILALYDGWSQAQPGFPTNSGPPQGIYFYQDENAVTEWGPRPNYGDPHVQTLIYDSITFLLKECRVSGFRWDSTICIRKGGTECWYEPDDLMDGYKMLQKANSIIDSFHGISIAEDLQGNQTVVTAVNKGGIGFTSQWDDNSYYQLHDVLGSQADSSRDINEYAQMLTQGDLTRTIYTENHDKASGQNAGQGRWPNIVDSSQPTSYIAQKLSTLGIATVFTAPGIPLIFYGQEFLDSQNFVFGDVPNLDWSKVGDFSGGKWNSIGPFNGIFNMTQDLIALRLNQVSGVDSSSLMTTTIFTYQLSQQNKVLAFTRGSNNNLVVLMNLSSVAYNSGYIIGAPAAGSWSIVFNSDLKKYSSAFGGVGTGVSSISSQPNSYGPFSNSINVPLGAYSCVILVRN